jgi:polysaccharide export outer membrane protein
MKKTVLSVLVFMFAFTASSHSQPSSETLEEVGRKWAGEEDVLTWEGGTREPSPRYDYTRLSQVTYPEYPIQPHTILNVRIKGDEPHLADPGITLKVSTKGYINVPYIGDVEVKNLTEEELAVKIERQLQKDYVRSPEVTVSIVENPGYWLMGAVQYPGRYDMVMEREMTLKEAIELAGGYRERQDISLFRWGWTYIRVTRTEENERRLYEFKLDTIPETFVVKPDDIIICRYGEMPELGEYYIFGEVTNPGKYPIVPDSFSGKKLFRFSSTLNRYIEILGASNVVDAVFNAQELSENAARNWVWVVRTTGDGTKKRFKIPMGEIYYKGDMSKNMRLKDGDIITVSESWF